MLRPVNDGLLDRRLEPSTLVELLRLRGREEPDSWGQIFLTDGDRAEARLSYGELDRRARAIAVTLRALGCVGQPVLVVFPSGLDFVAGFFGCLYAGAIPVVASPPRPNRPLTRFEVIVRDSGSRVILTQEALRARLESRELASGLAGAFRWVTTEGIDGNLAEAWATPDVNPDSIALLQYTSGSVAAPRGTMVSHRNLLHNSHAIYEAFEHTRNTIIVGWLPLSHDMGLIGNLLQALYVGCPYVFMAPEAFLMRPLRWLQAISRYRGTTSGAPDFAFDLCSRRIAPGQRTGLDLSSWDVAFNGSERVRTETIERFSTDFAPCGFRREAFYPCYGLAEGTLLVSGGSKADPPIEVGLNAEALGENRAVHERDDVENPRVLVGCGRTRLDQKICIVDPATARPAQAGHIGEIWVSGPSVALGYWGQPRETQAVFRASLRGDDDAHYLRTGDLGFFLDGNLYIAGRLKDLIIIGGVNHFPTDIETTVERCHGAIRPHAAAAFAVDIEGRERLVVVAEVDRRYAGSAPTVEPVRQAVREAVSCNHDLAVRAVCLIRQSTIPRTSSGKIQRHLCRKRYLAGELDIVQAAAVKRK